jgi:N-acetylglucosaminyl-diphospho-decaprenol L-rhamnosyltransferase
MHPAIDIIIVNWNSSASLQSCLASLFASARCQYDLTRIVVVDNGSEDDCADVVSQFGGVELRQNSSNHGFAAACNNGAKGSRADYLLFLNPDTEVETDAMDKVVSVISRPENAGVGICGIRLQDQAGRPSLSCSRFPTTWSLVLEMSGLDRLGRGIFKMRHFMPDDLTEDRNVDQIIGAFFLIRRALFEALGGFDERFFVYFEEVDLSLRARQRGYTARFVSGAAATHIGRVSSNQSKALRLFYFVRSRLLYAEKHLGTSSFVLILLFSVLIEPVARMCSAAAGSSESSLRQVVRGYRELYVSLARAAWRQLQRQALAREDA